jgi:hypothetical protein
MSTATITPCPLDTDFNPQRHQINGASTPTAGSETDWRNGTANCTPNTENPGSLRSAEPTTVLGDSPPGLPLSPGTDRPRRSHTQAPPHHPGNATLGGIAPTQPAQPAAHTRVKAAG